jgi:hypothetical protein
MKFTVTIDVEEEGLFSGIYSADDSSAFNVYQLDRLDQLFMELGIRPTLLVSYQVANKKDVLEKLRSLKKRWNAEVGAHLHHWNTPPIVVDTITPPAPSELLSSDLLEAKTRSLMGVLQESGLEATSFRMGRFNLGPKMFQILEQLGIKVDSSVAPMRREYGGANHLWAPTDPYFPDPLDPTRTGNSNVLEVPVTILPILKGIDHYLKLSSKAAVTPRSTIEWLAINLGSISPQPAWVNLGVAKAGVMLHKSRGGDCVTIFFHSSELAPGLNPLNPTEEAVSRFIKRLAFFIQWLINRYNAKCHTLSELYPLYKVPGAAPKKGSTC